MARSTTSRVFHYELTYARKGWEKYPHTYRVRTTSEPLSHEEARAEVVGFLSSMPGYHVALRLNEIAVIKTKQRITLPDA